MTLIADQMDRLNTALEGRYLVEREIGRGGMGSVFLARDLRHDRPVALKAIRPELAHSFGAERFLREIRVTARLDHPNILPLLDSGDAGGILFYVMPYVAGESLRDRLTREGPLPLDDAIRFAREVAEALHHAHDRGVIHRDIKPENVLLAGGHARVVDFGIARAAVEAGGEALTSTGLAIGTPAYMSPEQAGGARSADARSDLYSLGCLLYEMLAGRPPFTGATPQEILARHAIDPVPSLAAARPGLPAGVEQVVTRALAKSPADRFASAAQLAESLPGQASGGTQVPRAVARGPAWWPFAAGAVALVTVAAAFLLLRDRGTSPPAHPRSAIAVLPFQYLSADEQYAYFASGLHDELLSQLSKIGALQVVSRTSVMRFAGTTAPLREIAAALGVGSIVEGSVQVEGGRLRVNVQLIDASTDAHLWADRYDRTLDDAFAIQSEVAQHIVTAVGVALTSAESQGIARLPTANPEAYRLYLQGREYWLRPGRLQQDYETAQQLLERAIALDPGFALAHVALAEVHGLTWLLRYDPSPARMDRSLESAETAIRLAPDLPQAHEVAGLALALGRGNYEQALELFTRALPGHPDPARVWQRIGFSNRVLGRWPEALSAFNRSIEHNPHDADLFLALAMTQELTGQYADAVRTYEQGLALAPDLHSGAVGRGWTFVRWQGGLDSLEAALAARSQVSSLGALGPAQLHRLVLRYWRRDAAGMLDLLAAGGGEALEWELAYRPTSLLAAWAHGMRGDSVAFRAALDSARTVVEARLTRTPDDWRVWTALGLIHAARGRRDSALLEVRRLEGRARHVRGYLDVQMVEDRARILAQAGETGAALDLLEELLQGPSWVSLHTLRLDPTWDPLRRDPRFTRLASGSASR